jgi:hypothetical protein
LDRRLCGPQSRSGRGGEEKNYQPLPGLKPPIIQPVVQCYTTELSQPRLKNKMLQQRFLMANQTSVSKQEMVNECLNFQVPYIMSIFGAWVSLYTVWRPLENDTCPYMKIL